MSEYKNDHFLISEIWREPPLHAAPGPVTQALAEKALAHGATVQLEIDDAIDTVEKVSDRTAAAHKERKAAEKAFAAAVEVWSAGSENPEEAMALERDKVVADARVRRVRTVFEELRTAPSRAARRISRAKAEEHARWRQCEKIANNVSRFFIDDGDGCGVDQAKQRLERELRMVVEERNAPVWALPLLALALVHETALLAVGGSFEERPRSAPFSRLRTAAFPARSRELWNDIIEGAFRDAIGKLKDRALASAAAGEAARQLAEAIDPGPVPPMPPLKREAPAKRRRDPEVAFAATSGEDPEDQIS